MRKLLLATVSVAALGILSACSDNDMENVENTTDDAPVIQNSEAPATAPADDETTAADDTQMDENDPAANQDTASDGTRMEGTSEETTGSVETPATEELLPDGATDAEEETSTSQ